MNTGEAVRVRINGQEREVPVGSIAHALLAAGITTFRRTLVNDAPRNIFCGMGSCYDCLVSVDGEPVRACITPITKGMKISTRGHHG